MSKSSGYGKKAAGFGEVLRHLRKERGLLQGHIADRMGVNQSQIPKWERERQGMRLDSLVELLDALDTGMEEFGRLFDKQRRGESLVESENDEELAAIRAKRIVEPEPPARRGRAAIFLWEEEGEGALSQLPPEVQEDLDEALRDVRYALDRLRPPEERPRPDKEEEVTDGNGDDGKD